MGNSTPCKIVTPENFSSTVCTRDYVGDGNNCANFGENRFSGGFFPSRWNSNAFVTFLTVLSCPFFSILRPGQNVGPIFTLYGSNDVFPHKEVPFGGSRRQMTPFGELCLQNGLKVGVNGKFQANMPKYESRSISKTVNPTKPKFEIKQKPPIALRRWATTTLNQIQHGWRPPSWKSLWRHNSAKDDPISVKFGMRM